MDTIESKTDTNEPKSCDGPIAPPQPAISYSGYPEWATPWGLYRLLESEFPFSYDLAASAENAKHRHFINAATDAFSLDSWSDARCLPFCGPSPRFAFLNPPYSKLPEPGKIRGAPAMPMWLERAWVETQTSPYFTIVALIPATPDRQWWSWCEKAAEIRMLCGRVNYTRPRVGSKKDQSPPQGSAVVIFRRRPSFVPVAQSWWDWKTSFGRMKIAAAKDISSGFPPPDNVYQFDLKGNRR